MQFYQGDPTFVLCIDGDIQCVIRSLFARTNLTITKFSKCSHVVKIVIRELLFENV